jgi:hypothetical protein
MGLDSRLNFKDSTTPMESFSRWWADSGECPWYDLKGNYDMNTTRTKAGEEWSWD